MKFGKEVTFEIIITPTNNYGFHVRVGCGRFAFSNKEDLRKAFNDFLDAPRKYEEEYIKTASPEIGTNIAETEGSNRLEN